MGGFNYLKRLKEDSAVTGNKGQIQCLPGSGFHSGAGDTSVTGSPGGEVLKESITEVKGNDSISQSLSTSR